ncbi:MAG: Lrp/AsnC family transcriptional regulator [Thermoprotei archaeon]|nr:MAG: Lrp/AsnC family transcriptional regulator [Thermoprotei archaeon]
MSLSEKIVSYVLVVVSIGKEFDVLNKIKDLPGITEAVVVYGEYDLVVRIEADNMKVIDNVVTSIRNIPSVLRTVTLIGYVKQ